jgi:hypothetical protein
MDDPRTITPVVVDDHARSGHDAIAHDGLDVLDLFDLIAPLDGAHHRGVDADAQGGP